MLQYTHLRHERCTYWTLAEKEFTKLTLENIYTRTENLSFIRHSIAHGDLGRSSHLRAASSPGHGGRSRGRRSLLIVGTLARLGKLLAELLLFLLTAHLAELLSGARVRHFLTAWANVRGGWTSVPNGEVARGRGGDGRGVRVSNGHRCASCAFYGWPRRFFGDLQRPRALQSECAPTSWKACTRSRTIST